jgi:hypothetical protein
MRSSFHYIVFFSIICLLIMGVGCVKNSTPDTTVSLNNTSVEVTCTTIKNTRKISVNSGNNKQNMNSDMQNNDQSTTAEEWTQKKADMGEFKSIFIDFAKIQNIAESSIEMDAFRDITPENVFKETGCQIFKNGKTCESYLLYERKLYTLGIGFGGLGIVDIVSCDFDDNGKKELLYTYSWGSGIHRSCFGYFDLSQKCEVKMDISSAQSLGFIHEELALKKISDTQFEVYTATVKIDGGDFAKLSLKKDNLFGEIKAVKNKPVLFIK